MSFFLGSWEIGARDVLCINHCACDLPNYLLTVVHPELTYLTRNLLHGSNVKLCNEYIHIIHTMISYFLRWTLLKISSRFPINHGQQTVRQLSESHMQWLIHQMSARYCRNFEFMTDFSQRILERVFVRSIVIIRNEYFFSMGNESERGINKSSENHFAIHAICLSRAPIHSPWIQ